MTNDRSAYDRNYDLSNCDAEPLRRIRYVQPCALVLAVDKEEWNVAYISENLCRLLGRTQEDFPRLNLRDVLTEDTITILQAQLTLPPARRSNPIHVTEWRNARNEAWQNLLLYETEHHLILEFEKRSPDFSRSDFLRSVDQAVLRLQRLEEREDIFHETTLLVRELTGYDRVMIYRFDEEYNGEMIAEARADHQESYLGLRYPHTDIPEQARRMYLRNEIRQIATTDAASEVYLFRAEGSAELDLTPVAGRGVSRIHLEYLNNMGVGASFSAAIILEGRLWGLIACHHSEAKRLDYRMRSMIGFFCRIIASHLMLRQTQIFRSEVLQTQLLRSQLFERMSKDYEVVEGLLDKQEVLLAMMDAGGCILRFDEQVHAIGQVPQPKDLEVLFDLLDDRDETLFHTDELTEAFPAVSHWETPPAGLLSIRISRQPGEYIAWFRPEVSKTVQWGGNPAERKLMVNNEVRLNPNVSFALWEERVKGKAEPWLRHHLDVAMSLRNDIKEIIIQRYQKIRTLNAELTSAYQELESFSYSVSHDLRSPLRTIKGFAEILEEDYGAQLDEEGKMILHTIVRSVIKMNTFIQDMLNFSRVGRAELAIYPVDIKEIIEEAWRSLEQSKDVVELVLPESLPEVPADATLLRQVFVNLLSNAVKYSGQRATPRIEITSRTTNDEVVVEVSDNGIGFAMEYADQIFQVFRRLVRDDEYEGSGVGLAIVKRIMENHEGKVGVNSVPGEGTTFILRFQRHLKLNESKS